MSRYRDEYYSSSRDRRRDADVQSVASGRSRPAFLERDDPPPGELVIRTRGARRRSPSPVYVEERRVVRVERSESPPPARGHPRGRSVPRPVRAESRVRIVDREIDIERERSISPEPVRVRHVRRRGSSESVERVQTKTRIDVTETTKIERSPSPERRQVVKGPTMERDIVTHWTDVDHRKREPTPPPMPEKIQGPVIEREVVTHWHDVDHRKRSPSPPPMPKKIQGPTIEREVITHWHDVDHGVIRVNRSPSPPPPPPVKRDIDIDVDIIHRHDSRHESRHGRSRGKSVGRGRDYDETDVVVHAERDTRRSMSLAPIRHDSGEAAKINVNINHSGKSKRESTWTEITKDVVIKEAIERRGYQYDEAHDFFYIKDRLEYDDVKDLVDLSARMKDHRRRHSRHSREHDHHVEVDIDVNDRGGHNPAHYDQRPNQGRSRDYDMRDPTGRWNGFDLGPRGHDVGMDHMGRRGYW